MPGITSVVGDPTGGFSSSFRPDPPDAAEREFVAKKRRLRASWQAVAGMIGRSVEDTRKWHDLTAEEAGLFAKPKADPPPEAEPEPPPPTTTTMARPPVIRRPPGAATGASSGRTRNATYYGSARHRAMQHLSGGALTVTGLAHARSISSMPARAALDGLCETGWAEIVGTEGVKGARLYALTHEGRAALAKIEAAG